MTRAFPILAGGLGLVLGLVAGPGRTAALTATFVDPAWDGLTVPKGMQCARHGGPGAVSPALKVSKIPAGTVRLVLEFDDEDYGPLSSDGGHGKFAFAVPAGAAEVVVPSIPQGVTEGFPKGVTMLAGNRSGIAPGYLPPCSGGRGHRYSITIRAMSAAGKPLGKRDVPMGRY